MTGLRWRKERGSEPSLLLTYDIQSCLSQFNIQRCQFSIMVFKAFIFFSLAFRAASLAWHSELLSLIVWRSEPHLQLVVQSHQLFTAWRSEPPSVLSFGVQSHHLLTTRHSEPSSILSYDIQSHLSQFDIQSQYPFLIMAFRAFIFFSLMFRATSPTWRSESLSLHSLTFKAFIFFSLVFKVAPPTWHSESLSLLSYGVQGLIFFSFGIQSHVSILAFRHPFSVWAFRAIISFQFGVQSHHLFSV